MIKYTASEDWGWLYEKEIAKAGIPHLIEVTYDHDLEMHVITFTVNEDHAKRVSEIMQETRTTVTETLRHCNFNSLQEASAQFGFYNSIDTARMLQEIYEEDNAPLRA